MKSSARSKGVRREGAGPRRSPRMEVATSASREADPARLGRVSPSVLVVDDEPMIRGLLGAILGDAGYRVLEAVDGEDALSVYRQHADDVDLVILDVMMPRMDGRATLQNLKARWPHVKVLLASGFTPEVVGRDLLALDGVLGFIQKPFDQGLLLRWVAEGVRPDGRKGPGRHAGQGPRSLRPAG